MPLEQTALTVMMVPMEQQVPQALQEVLVQLVSREQREVRV